MRESQIPTVMSMPAEGHSTSFDRDPRFSVIIPTYQRRDLIVSTVMALAGQRFAGTFETIVVVDGATDGTAEALRVLQPPFPLTIIEQDNMGSAAARNRGAIRARGEFLLFLDDDMEAHPDLLAEHEASHRAGAAAVMGHIPIHPQSPPGLLTVRVGIWAEDRAKRLSQPGATPGLEDMLTGQLSLRRDLFERLAGFDIGFRQQVTSGNADTDFGCRLLESGCAVVFNPRAISWQTYIVTPRSYLRRFREVGRADVRFVKKHPEQFDQIFTARKLGARRRWMIPPVALAVRGVAVRLVTRGRTDERTVRWFTRARWCEYWLGVREAGGIPRRVADGDPLTL
jgi:glycosyltransferase involved in cell wall biosynthesis